ncbi:NmrA domain-containing protein [Mycena chlorophos]|uniref:NmrA domain-containing protein n=1 Tax=Mycena chlorophos TaxID=658473 RepID=A0A8H6SNF9_MYCCL|nr:NmrA domain-containing protein [Mycena chlorophos]
MSQTPQYSNVLVFGATGGVGGFVALEAHKRGAKVWLAMRDTSKTISEIPADVEKAAGASIARVQADLTDAASVTKAVAESGAKAAFIYLIANALDKQRNAIKALREAGVENIVFLSSYGVQAEGDALRAIPQSEIIPFVHAQVEIAIEDLAFPSFVALRPASFASNFFKNYLDRSAKPPKAQIIHEDAYADNIVPEDIGAVGAVVLLSPPATGKTSIFLAGSPQRQAKDSWALIKQITGRTDIDTTPTSPDAFVATFTAKGMPEAMPRYLLKILDRARGGFSGPAYEAGVANVSKYLGREPTSFEQYLEKHKAEWQSA